MPKMLIVLVAIMAGVFAGPYTEYCIQQTDPCFQSNCYKVNGNWAVQDDGTYDCMYDTSAYSDYEVQSAFADCIAQEEECEQAMAAAGNYSQPGMSPAARCGPALMFAGIAGAAVFARRK